VCLCVWVGVCGGFGLFWLCGVFCVCVVCTCGYVCDVCLCVCVVCACVCMWISVSLLYTLLFPGARGIGSDSLGDASCTTGIAAALYSDVRTVSSRLPNGGLSCRLSSAADVVSTLSTFPPLPPSSMNVLVYRSSIISCFLFHRALL